MIHTLSRWLALPTRPTSHEASSCRTCLASAVAVLYPLLGGTWFGKRPGIARAQRREPYDIGCHSQLAGLPHQSRRINFGRSPGGLLGKNYFYLSHFVCYNNSSVQPVII
jgi:hypothetical protein